MFEGPGHWLKLTITKRKNVSFSAVDALYDVTYFLVVNRVLCAKVVGAISTEGFLAYKLSSIDTAQGCVWPESIDSERLLFYCMFKSSLLNNKGPEGL